MNVRPFICKAFKRPARIDHQPMYVAIVFAMGLWSGSLILFGPTPNSVIKELPISTQYYLATVIFSGAFLCQAGIFINTRWVVIKRLKRLDVRSAYAFGIGGIPAIAFPLEIYFIAIISGSTSPFTSALGSAVSFAIPLGALWNMMMFIVRRWEFDDYLAERRKEVNGD